MAIVVVIATATSSANTKADERRPGGATTSFKPINALAFSHPASNMKFRRELDFRVGEAVFRKLWVSSPSSTVSSDGLGPLYNARSCQSCHLKNGRGRPPVKGEPALSLLMRLSIPPQDVDQRRKLRALLVTVNPEPTYGVQLQTLSVQGLRAEGRVSVEYSDEPVLLGDGERVDLRRPHYRLTNLSKGPLHADLMMSPRVASPVIGLGLIDMIPESDILRYADPEDADGDGVAGRPNQVWSTEHRKPMLGRFGWKAGTATIADQVAAAFASDMGLSTYLAPYSHGDCTAEQVECLAAPTGDDAAEHVEVRRQVFDAVVFYTRNVAVPARRQTNEAAVLRGKKLFADIGCGACHRGSYVTGHDADRPELSDATIWPYSDLLLHDMGEGLADNRPEGLAGGRHWRTPPLWGVGLTEVVSGHNLLLHDGRARGVLEAILWHGGEAEGAKLKVMRLTRKERVDLLTFIKSL